MWSRVPWGTLDRILGKRQIRNFVLNLATVLLQAQDTCLFAEGGGSMDCCVSAPSPPAPTSAFFLEDVPFPSVPVYWAHAGQAA